MGNKKGINIEDIISLYQEGKTPIQISEVYNCSPINISRRLKKAGFNVVRDSTKRRYTRLNRTEVDTSFFENIDTEEKAYFLGIMFSDGSVSRNQFYLKLKDEDVVVKFKEALKCNYAIRHNEIPYYNYILQISSIKMCEDLTNLGCCPNKTRVLKFPNIPNSLYRHFIRGFLDGDGCIRVGKTLGTSSLDIACASQEFIITLKEVLAPIAIHIGISKEKKYDVWHLRCGGRQVKTILDWLYKDSTVYMDRKYFKYQLLSSL